MKSFILILALLPSIYSMVAGYEFPPIPSTVESGVFPKDFQFGVSTSSYQVEGAWLEGGKGLSTWDAFSHTPGFVANGDTGDVANDMYHLYPKDIEIMKSMNIHHYRFSIMWNRILPTGVAPVNQEAIKYYNNLINLLLENNIEPHVTIYHAETPLALTYYPNNPNPFLDSTNFPKWFSDYANVLFENFGDRVKQWFTFNEPWCTAVLSIPGGEDPYRIAHNIILAHGTTAQLYRKKYQAKQGGTIGIVLNTAHFYPANSDNGDDVAAAQRAFDFNYEWFLMPLMKGTYPQSMIDTVGDRLPTFSDEEKQLITGTADFVAINYYFPFLVTTGSANPADDAGYYKDENVTSYYDPSWPLSQTGWGIYGPGLGDLLLYTSKQYPNLPIYVSENGLAWEEDNVTVAVDDKARQQYLHDHIDAVGNALKGGAQVKGYFHWSLQDNFEWGSGYQMHFGLTWISRPSLERVPKNSFRYYSKIIQTAQP